MKFDKQEDEAKALQAHVRELSPRSSNIESKLNLVVEKAEQMRVLSHIYIDRHVILHFVTVETFLLCFVTDKAWFVMIVMTVVTQH